MYIFIFRIVDIDFDMGQDLHDFIHQRIDQLRDTALEGVHGTAGIHPVLGKDQVIDPFGLGQVHAAVQERPFGKLTPPGQPGPLGNAQAQHLAGNEDAAMAVDFRHVLAGIGTRSVEHVDQHFVHRFVIFLDRGEMNGISFGLGQILPRQPGNNRQSLITAQPDDRNRPDAQCG